MVHIEKIIPYASASILEVETIKAPEGATHLFITGNVDVEGTLSGTVHGTASVAYESMTAVSAEVALDAGTASWSEYAVSASWAPNMGSTSTASYAETASIALVAPMVIPFNAAQGARLSVRVDTDIEEIPYTSNQSGHGSSRTLVDLTGYREARLIVSCTKHSQDVYLAAQFGTEMALVVPEASWSYLGASSLVDDTGINTDGWFPITGSAKQDVVLRTVASGSQNNASIEIGMLTLYVR